jgi:3-phosphoshikimate 1-carboxyvinyltransferase
MGRVIEPLREMGAHITSEGQENRAPLRIHGIAPDRPLRGFLYRSPVASAQVKSALLLAGLQAQGTTQIWEPVRSRDHTERMLPAFGVQVSVQGTTVSVTGGQSLHACELDVPGDVSSAAFFMGAALIVPNSLVRIREVGLNPTRTGVLDVFRAMGGSLKIVNTREVCGEPVGDVVVETSALQGIEIHGELVVRAIDEFPFIAVVAACARGTTTIRGAQELRVKESDRIQTIAAALRTLGVTLTELPDGLIIEGTGLYHAPHAFRSGRVRSAGDHRIAMALSVAGLVAAEPIVLEDASCVAISFPDFYRLVQDLTGTRVQAE